MKVLAGTSRIKVRAIPPVRYVYVPAQKVSTPGRIWRVIKMLAGAALIASLLSAWPAVYREAVTHPYFRIRSVEINGLKTISRRQLLSVMRPLLTGSILTCDIGAVAGFLRKNPWIGGVSIRRRLPDTVEINLVERIPAAVVRIGPEKLYLIDEDGFVLDETGGAGDRVVFTGLADAAGAVIVPGDRIRGQRLQNAFRISGLLSADRVFLDHAAVVDVSDTDRITVRTKLTGGVIHFGPEKSQWGEKFLEYLVVRKVLAETGAPFSVMDLSFKDQVVVSPGEGPPEQEQTINKKG